MKFSTARFDVEYIEGNVWSINDERIQVSHGLSDIVMELIKRGDTDPRLPVMGGFGNAGLRLTPLEFISTKHKFLTDHCNTLLSGTRRGVTIGCD